MYHRPLTKEIEEIARLELNETPQQRVETLRHIEEWIKKHTCIKLRTDGLWVLNFIRGCKFSTQKTKQKIETYLKTKEVVPDILLNRDPLLPQLQDMLKKGAILPFGTPDKECVIARWECIDFNKVYFTDLMKLSMMFLDIFMNESETCMAVGHYVVVDCKGFSLGFLAQLTPFLINRIFYNMVNAYPLRIKRIYFINCVPAIETVYSIAKSVISAKIQNRVSFYGENYTEIYDSIPKKYFPQEYGGCAGSLETLTDVWKKKVESCREWFLDDSVWVLSDNKASVTNAKAICNGTEGSFRKLSFD